ncbi:hypothetical protein BDZ91DRAFT_728066 [Kalaharituber pfeilii]|nr:hypothetical protein BDZ91DRAFT_728066 [Kalaharituber pfeilii]
MKQNVPIGANTDSFPLIDSRPPGWTRTVSVTVLESHFCRYQHCRAAAACGSWFSQGL